MAKKKATISVIPIEKIILYLGQTAICIKQKKDTEKKERMKQIAQEEVAKHPKGVQAGRECVDLDNAIIKIFRQMGIY